MNTLHDYCMKWGLTVNQKKTKVVIFTNARKYRTDARKFTMGKMDIEIVESYTYLGVTFHRHGTFKIAINELRKKALRALYGMRRQY